MHPFIYGVIVLLFAVILTLSAIAIIKLADRIFNTTTRIAQLASADIRVKKLVSAKKKGTRKFENLVGRIYDYRHLTKKSPVSVTRRRSAEF